MKKGDIISLIQKDSHMMDVLRAVETLRLSDWWIGAGFVRSKVWDYLHKYNTPTPLPDVDVIYFDLHDFSDEETKSQSTKYEKLYEAKLKKLIPELKWSVTNQARMHILHHDKPYKNSIDALSRWVETATCIGVGIGDDGKVKLCAPHGISDLTSLKLRPVIVTAEGIETFNKRVEDKKWLEKWPKLKIIKV